MGLSLEYRNSLWLFLEICSTKTGTHTHPKTFTRMCIAVPFIIVKNWKQPNDMKADRSILSPSLNVIPVQLPLRSSSFMVSCPANHSWPAWVPISVPWLRENGRLRVGSPSTWAVLKLPPGIQLMQSWVFLVCFSVYIIVSCLSCDFLGGGCGVAKSKFSYFMFTRTYLIYF